jgi:hypothetical protein
MALVRSDQKGLEEIQRIRVAMADGCPVPTETQRDLIKRQTALLGEDGDTIIRGIQEEAKTAGRLPADISKVIEKCCQELAGEWRAWKGRTRCRGRELQRLLQVEAMTEQVTRYAGAKGKGENAGLMKVKQTLPDLVASYMKDLEADEKDGLFPDVVKCGRRWRSMS